MDIPQSRNIIANKECVILGKKYKKGDSVDTKNLQESKVNQLLNQRWLRFADA